MANGFFSDILGLASDVGGFTDPFAGGDISAGLGDITTVASDLGLDVSGGALSGTFPAIFQSGAASMSGPSGFFPSAHAAGVMPMIAGVGRSLATRFPQLAFAIQAWRAKGVALTVEKLWGMLRRFGPQMLIAGGILTAGAITELIMHHFSHKRRRMNVLNAKALRRSTRRLLGFERRACKVQDALRSVTARSYSRHRTKARRCFKCHRSPCVCN